MDWLAHLDQVSHVYLATIASDNGFLDAIWHQTLFKPMLDYRQVSDIRRTLISNSIFDLSDVVGASHVGAAPTTSLCST